MLSEKLVLFIDAQNFYNGARDAFFSRSDWHIYGQFKPIELGELLCSKAPAGIARVLHEGRIYTGRPDPTLEPKTYSAHMRQCEAWQRAGAKVIWRPLRYLRRRPPGEQKGIDVAIAIDFIRMAIDGDYDVGVIASTDTDLLPAMEFVCERYKGIRRVQSAAWTSPTARSALMVNDCSMWWYYLDRNDYNSVADLSDYTV